MSPAPAAPFAPNLDALTAVASARDAALAHDKPATVRRVDAIEALLGSGWSPMKQQLRAAQSAADISRWDLVLAHLSTIEDLLSPHPPAQG